MRIHAITRVSHPVDRVYGVYRDRLVELAAYMDNVKDIIVRKQESIPEGVRYHNEWVAKQEIPGFARRFITPEMLRWDDYADWHDEQRRAHWTIKTRVFSEAVSCRGTTTIEEAPGGSEVVVNGELSLDLRKVKAVPRILAGSLGPKMEAFIVKMITPNLEATNLAIQRFLDREG